MEDAPHLIKLAVGVRSFEDMSAPRPHRPQGGAPDFIRTRSMPRQAEAIVAAQSSLFWVITGFVAARQRILDLVEDRYEDGSLCCRIVLEPALVRVAGRVMRPFQGWRYLPRAAAPADLPAEMEGLPPELAQRLRELCLL